MLGSYLYLYKDGDEFGVKVNFIMLVEMEFLYLYYSLFFCRFKEGIKKVVENIGEFFMGDEIENLFYKFKMWIN